MDSRPRLVPWWKRARAYLTEDPVLGGVVRATPEHQGLAVCDDVMRTYLRTVAGQQVSGASAAALTTKVLAAAGHTQGEELAQALIALGEKGLAAAGLSRGKSTALLGLAAGYMEGSLRRQALLALDAAALVSRLTALRGVGPWSADMIRIFALGQENVLALTDYGVRKAIEELGADCQAQRRWSPFGTAATWFLWKSRGTPAQY
ncbi:MAG: DNA-3-methyladenine glycosylase family protein [Duodenibacillus sp.]